MQIDNDKVEILPKKTRKRKYSPDMCEKIIEIAANGGHVAQMCVELGIGSKDTFYRWLNEYPEFAEAYETAKLHSQAFWESVGTMGTTGQLKGFNATTYAIIMNNKFSEDYKRSGTGSNTEINIDNRSVNVEQLSNEQLDQRLKELSETLSLPTTYTGEKSNET